MTHQKQLKAITLAAALALTALPALAAVPSLLMPGFKTIEAGSVELLVDAKTGDGIAVARECATCPLQTKVDKSTEFFVQGKAVPLSTALTHSLKFGAIQYKVDTMHAERIIW